MPELPEVETVVRDLRAQGLEGARVAKVEVYWPRTVGGAPVDNFVAAVVGRTIEQITRRGKYIVMRLDTRERLLVHLRMTGKLRLGAAGEVVGKHDHLVLELEDGRRLFFNDTRKFGRVSVACDNASPVEALGPEPLEPDFTVAVLRSRVADKGRAIKPLLLDQATVAGLGNIYVDEALWQARIHPQRVAKSLSSGEIKRLHSAIRTVLKRGIVNCGTTLGSGADNFYSVAGRRGRNADALRVFRRDGEPCPRCRSLIERSVVGQRGTHFCPQCQPI